MVLMAEVLRVSFLLVGIAVRSNFVCVRFANVGLFFIGYTSQAGRSTACGYSILFLALSTIAFSMTPY
jgi:hypothetical protein